jgi:hypothetical protein
MQTKTRKNVASRLKENGRLIRPKYIRDPIHDLITMNMEIYVNLLNSKAMQRLRRIQQLGAASLVFPGANHTRFSHSLGAFHVAARLLNQLSVKEEYSRIVVMCAALLHDVGHGPFSHLFEELLQKFEYPHTDDRKHTTWTKKIIMEDNELGEILTIAGETLLRNDVRDLISGTYFDIGLSKIIDSQFDCDRLDYMLRDSKLTGVNYGNYDLAWLLRCLSLEDIREGGASRKEVVVDIKRGISCLDHYLLGNLYLYKHVYFHKAVQSGDCMLVNLILRALDLIKVDKQEDAGIEKAVMRKIAQGDRLSVTEYCQLDDYVIMSWVHGWANNPAVDSILHDLAKRLLERKLFKTISIGGIPGDEQKRIVKMAEELLEQQGKDPRYYMYDRYPSRIAYQKIDPNEIWISGEARDDLHIKYSELKGTLHPVSTAIREFAGFGDHILMVPSDIRERITDTKENN